MNAKISYKVDCLPHPWNEKHRSEGVHAWCLVKVTTPAYGDKREEAVAIFNFDSEAEQFQAEVIISGLESLIGITDATKEVITRRLKR